MHPAGLPIAYVDKGRLNEKFDYFLHILPSPADSIFGKLNPGNGAATN
jgi:hypothetical protein